MRPLVIGGRRFTNRFFLGTGKFASREQTRAALAASETELVTVALTRVHEDDAGRDDILAAIDRSAVEVMLNTSGARTADEAEWLPKVSGYAATRSSDAHNLDDVARVWTEADLDSFSVAGLKAAFAARTTSLSPRLTNF